MMPLVVNRKIYYYLVVRSLLEYFFFVFTHVDTVNHRLARFV